MSGIKEAIKRLSKSNTGFDAMLELAIVKSVDESAMTCSVALIDNDELILDQVKLKPIIAGTDVQAMGIVLFPAIGSHVIIGQINASDTDLFVVLASKVNKISFDAGSAFKMLMNLQSGAVALDMASLVFNAGKKGGLPMVAPLTEKINRLEKKVNELITDFKSHKHSGVTTGPGLSAIPDTIRIEKIDKITKLDDIENKEIKQ